MGVPGSSIQGSLSAMKVSHFGEKGEQKGKVYQDGSLGDKKLDENGQFIRLGS